MNKKRFLIFAIVGFVLLQLVGAQTTDYSEGINKAFSCLANLTEKNPALTLPQATFLMIAGAGNGDKVMKVINVSETNDRNCWPIGACDVKQTAQIALAYKKQNLNNDVIISWLKNQTDVPQELTWYMQVIADNNQNASCLVGYDGQNYNFNLNSDASLTAQSGYGSCLNYDPEITWLRIANSCVGKKFTVSCNGNFTKFNVAFSFLDQRGTINYISPSTQSGDSGSLVLAGINIRCFKKTPSSSGCDYESSLWASTALYDKGENIGNFVPYLKALASNNEKYFPDAFLVYLVNGQNQYLASLNQKRKNAHWSISGSPYSSFYDTGLGILGLGGINSAGVKDTGTLTYLFDTGQQTNEGCWNNNDISDSAFLLYALGVGKSYKTNPSVTTGGGVPLINFSDSGNNSSGGAGSASTDCESAGFYCTQSSADCFGAGGYVQDQYNCHNLDRCCTMNVPQSKGCTELGGRICAVDQTCSSPTVQSFDGACCLDICQLKETNIPTDDNNDQTGNLPESNNSGSNLWIWIILLVLLILIVILLILYRNKLRIWWLKRKGNVKTSKIPPTPPGMFPANLARPMPPPRFGPPPQRPVLIQPRNIVRQPESQKDKEIEETLRKLKKISEG